MTGWMFALLVGAGILAGLFGAIGGLASLASYPALLLAGLTPTSANVTNTVALVADPLRAAIALAGLGLAVKLGVDAGTG